MHPGTQAIYVQRKGREPITALWPFKKTACQCDVLHNNEFQFLPSTPCPVPVRRRGSDCPEPVFAYCSIGTNSNNYAGKALVWMNSNSRRPENLHGLDEQKPELHLLASPEGSQGVTLSSIALSNESITEIRSYCSLIQMGSS